VNKNRSLCAPLPKDLPFKNISTRSALDTTVTALLMAGM
jgi:hypothetical protein